MRHLLVAALLATGLVLPPAAQARVPAASFATLHDGQILNGFKAVARYRDADNHPMGARFVHLRSGFTLDVLRIQTVPQAFIWVNSWPTSDMGEPHTQEHLLLGKGNKGRAVANLDSMSLAETTAYTEQRRTCYQFDTAAGLDTFYKLFQDHLDALLHPDYTDEEIRREVRNFGVTPDAKTGQLHLEEKGTVYNEMVSTYTQPGTQLFHDLNVAQYGKDHPLAFESGGTPEALRVLEPGDIRKFHDANYHLANMGMIASLPKEESLDAALARFGTILNRLEPKAHRLVGTFKTPDDLPPPHPAPAARVEIGTYPDENPQDPGQLLFAWPAANKFTDNRDYMRAELFVGAIAGDATTNLYKLFIDTKTRVADLGATGVYGYVDSDEGHPIVVGLNDVKPVHLTDHEIKDLRAKMQGELQRIASWPDGSPALAAFNKRVQALVHERHRALDKFVNSPPGFGFRGTSSAWMEQLDRLAHDRGFDKSVTMDADLAAIDHELSGRANGWRGAIARWHLTSVTPRALATRPDPAMVKQAHEALEARLEAQVKRLETRYHQPDAQRAIKAYAHDYDLATARLEQAAATQHVHFLDHPPLANDPLLDFRTTNVGGIPLVASTFDNMSSSTIGLSLRLDTVAPDDMVYLALMPALMTQVGVIDHGKPVSFEEMSDRLRNEVLGLDAYFSHNPHTRRNELTLRGSGNDAAEAKRAVDWMYRVAYAPDWRPENLPRIRDVVDQAVGSLHETMKGAEETWVENPVDAYQHQDDLLMLATDSFLTREHLAHRLRWRLRDAGTLADRGGITRFLAQLAGLSSAASRSELQTLAETLAANPGPARKLEGKLAAPLAAYQALTPRARANATEACKDLAAYVPELPDNSLAADWSRLCLEMRDDLQVTPGVALAGLERVRQQILNAHHARMFVVGSRQHQAMLLKDKVPGLVAGLARNPVKAIAYDRTPYINARLAGRTPGARPVFVGLLDPNLQSGVFVNRAPAASYTNTRPDALMDFLAAGLRGGGGADSMFMKTWAAGLAYSNGLSANAHVGEIHYYAERCPELPQTLRFVIGEVKKSPREEGLVESAIALAFDDTRMALPYESRGEDMAADLADGITPAVVSRFHRAVLALRSHKGLMDELYRRMPGVYGKVLPGLSVKSDAVKGGVYFVIGPEKQMELYEAYLKSAEGAGATLYRLYPRDFWLPD